jgi:4-carboxymuconolactone decarboxylase
LVELLMTIGFYMLVSRLLENLEVDIEDPPVH